MSTKIKQADKKIEKKSKKDFCIFLIYLIVAGSILFFIQGLNLLSPHNITPRISLQLHEANELLISRDSFIRIIRNEV